MTDPERPARYRRADGMSWDDAGDRVVILDAEGATLITLNPVGTLLWHELDEPSDTARMLERLTQTFPDVATEQLQEDIETFVDNLVAEGLLVGESESS